MKSPSDVFKHQFTVAAGLACLVELNLRLIADKTSALSKFAHSKSVQELETAFLDHFGKRLGDEKVALLTKSRQLRNKIVHSDFYAASAKADEASPGTLKKGTVFGGRFPDLAGTMKKVSETTRKEGTVFGWLLECGSNGTFLEAAKLFDEASQILEALSLELALEEAEKAP